MRKTLFRLFAGLLVGSALAVGMTACGGHGSGGSSGSGSGGSQEHVHNYKASYTESPTCTDKGYTMYVCDCGDHFKANYVDELGHAYGEWTSNGDGTHTKTCAHDSTHKVTEDCTGGVATETERPVCDLCHGAYGAVIGHTHAFTEQKTTDKYLVSSATCTEKAVYYYSCECGEKGTETFEYGTELGHAYGEWMSSGDDTHSKTCKNDPSHKMTEKCNGGTATCTEQAMCADCGAKYGTIAAHTYNQKNTDSTYLKSKATCTKKAVYYYSCQCGAKGATTFEYGELASHTESDWVIDVAATTEKEGSKHTYCTVCNKTLQTATIEKLKAESVGLAYGVNSDGTTCEITGIGTCTDTDLVIPEKIDGYKVTSIGGHAFWGCSKLTSVTIPDSVTSIGRSAFWDCISLTSVTIGNSVTSVRDNAFYGCSSLTSVYYTGTVDDWVQIEFTTFSSNPLEYAKKLYINNELLTKAEITKATKISDFAFYGCSNLTSVTIGNSVTSIGGHAFGGCSSLTSVYYTGTVDDWVQIEFTTFSSNPLEYAKKLYINNELLTKAEITKATKISDFAFYGCSNLTSVTIGNSVTSIGGHAFWECSKLTSVTIPDSVTSIGDFAFANCSRISVYYTGTVDDWVQIDFKHSPLVNDGKLYIDNELLTNAEIMKATKISDFAFYGCSNLTSVTIGNSVTSIGGHAFSNCSSLTRVTIGNSVTSIDGSAFDCCVSLTSIDVDSGNEYYQSIDGNLYSKDGKTLVQYAIGKTAISFAIPNEVTSIGGACVLGV